jgi:hypothetical protein
LSRELNLKFSLVRLRECYFFEFLKLKIRKQQIRIFALF